MDVLPSRTIKVKSLDETVRVYFSCDWHVGSVGCAENKLKQDLAVAAKDKKGLVILGGDLGDFIAVDDRRFDGAAVHHGFTVADLADWGGAVARRVTEIAKPIRHKVVAYVRGNHEHVYQQRKQHDVARIIAEDLGLDYSGYSAFITLIFDAGDEQREVRFAITHGSGGGRTDGGKMNRLVQIMACYDADVVCVAHMHGEIWTEQIRVKQSGVQIGHTRQYGVVGGTYLRTYVHGGTTYGERMSLRPTPLASPVLEIRPRDIDMQVWWMR